MFFALVCFSLSNTYLRRQSRELVFKVRVRRVEVGLPPPSYEQADGFERVPLRWSHSELPPIYRFAVSDMKNKRRTVSLV